MLRGEPGWTIPLKRAEAAPALPPSERPFRTVFTKDLMQLMSREIRLQPVLHFRIFGPQNQGELGYPLGTKSGEKKGLKKG
jgi:hypothetical protein